MEANHRTNPNNDCSLSENWMKLSSLRERDAEDRSITVGKEVRPVYSQYKKSEGPRPWPTLICLSEKSTTYINYAICDSDWLPEA